MMNYEWWTRNVRRRHKLWSASANSLLRFKNRQAVYIVTESRWSPGSGNAVTAKLNLSGAQYHEATRSRSNAEFISKIESGPQELEESIYWLNLLIDSGIVKKKKLSGLCKEADELAAIFVASVKTVKRRR